MNYELTIEFWLVLGVVAEIGLRLLLWWLAVVLIAVRFKLRYCQPYTNANPLRRPRPIVC